MPQPSIAYAVGRVRASAGKLLGKAQFERLLSAATFDDARHILGEMGWTGAQEEDIGRLSVRMQELTCAKLRDISPDPDLTNAFLLRYDAQNLKLLLKARILGEPPEGLSGCGTLAPAMLEHAVSEHVYKKLPPELALVMEKLEKSQVLKVNPMEIDARIDQALYQMIHDKLGKIKSKAVRNYFTAKADLTNAITYLRLKAMKETDIPLKELLLPGGAIEDKDWLALKDHPEKLQHLFFSYGKSVVAAIIKAQQNHKTIPALEKAADDMLLLIFRPYRYDPFSIEVLIGWLLSYERETGAVRLIMAGKRNGFSQELIRERLRETYG